MGYKQEKKTLPFRSWRGGREEGFLVEKGVTSESTQQSSRTRVFSEENGTTGTDILKSEIPITREGRKWEKTDVPALVLCLAPVLLISMLISRYAVNVPYWDNWNMLIAPEVHRDSLLSHWNLANEHRMLIPRLIDIFLGRMSDFNVLLWVWAKVPVVILITTLEFLILRPRVSPRLLRLAVPFFSILNFTLVYWPLWMDPRPIGSHCAILGFLFSIWMIMNFPRRRRVFAAAVGGAVFSSLSFSSGNSSWLILGVLLWITGYRERKYVAAWTIGTLLVLVPYCRDVLDSSSAFRIKVTTAPGALARYALLFLASPLSPDHRAKVPPGLLDLAIGVFGILGVVVLTLLLKRISKKHIRAALPWVGITIWVGIAALAAGFGRASYSVNQPLAIRYISTSTVFWVALVALALLGIQGHAEISEKTRPRIRLISVVVLVMVAFLVSGANFVAFTRPKYSGFSERLKKGKHCLENIEHSDDACLELLYPDALYIRNLMRRIDVLNPSFLEQSEGEPPGVSSATSERDQEPPEIKMGVFGNPDRDSTDQ